MGVRGKGNNKEGHIGIIGLRVLMTFIWGTKSAQGKLTEKDTNSLQAPAGAQHLPNPKKTRRLGSFLVWSPAPWDREKVREGQSMSRRQKAVTQHSEHIAIKSQKRVKNTCFLSLFSSLFFAHHCVCMHSLGCMHTGRYTPHVHL